MGSTRGRGRIRSQEVNERTADLMGARKRNTARTRQTEQKAIFEARGTRHLRSAARRSSCAAIWPRMFWTRAA